MTSHSPPAVPSCPTRGMKLTIWEPLLVFFPLLILPSGFISDEMTPYLMSTVKTRQYMSHLQIFPYDDIKGAALVV